MKKKLVTLILGGMLAAAMPLAADEWTDPDTDYTWTYRINGDTAEIYRGSYSAAISPSPTGAVAILSMLGGKPATSIGRDAFYGCNGLTSVTISDSVTSIGDNAFESVRSASAATFDRSKMPNPPAGRLSNDPKPPIPAI